MQKPTPKKLYYLATFIVILLLSAGVLWKHNTHVQPAVHETSLVRTTVVANDKKSNIFTYSGEVRGRYESQLAFQVAGKIIKRNVDLGSIVKSGEVLMQIDPKDLIQASNSSSAQVDSAESQLRLATSNLQRFRQLYEQEAISRLQYDQYVAAYDAALALVRQTSAQYKQTANQLDYTQLRADMSGVVSAISAEAGQFVSTGQSVITVVHDGEKEIEISVPENRLNELRQAKQIKITFWALPGFSLDGGIREISPMADKVSRTYKVRISLLQQPPEIKLGMTASVELTNNTQDSTPLYIPSTAIYQTGESPAVWIVTDDTVYLRPIKTGSFIDNKIQVVEGLHAGDVIVTAGVNKLWEGKKVEIAGDSL